MDGKTYTWLDLLWRMERLDLPGPSRFLQLLGFAQLESKWGSKTLLDQLGSVWLSGRILLTSRFPTSPLVTAPALRLSPAEVAGFWDRYLDFIQTPEAAGIKQAPASGRCMEGTASRAAVKAPPNPRTTGTSDSPVRASLPTVGSGATPADSPIRPRDSSEGGPRLR